MAARRRSGPTTWIVLLRAVNVGGRSLPMADLRRLCEESGATGVRTYIQSGNVVLRSPRDEADLTADLAERIAAHAGFEVPVVARSLDELAAVVDGCPFDTTVDPTRLVVSFAAEDHRPTPLGDLDPDGFGDERLHLAGRDLYLWLPFGQGRSKLVQALGRTPFGRAATARNWKTVLVLLDLARQVDGTAAS
ncbi:MAG: DUF1697 domain-containing protein [Acidimicrobiales bacterium]